MKLSKILFIFCLCIALITACSKAKGEKKMENSSENKNRPVVEMKTNLGTVKIEMWSDLTPKTVENFTALAMGQKEWTDSHFLFTKKPFPRQRDCLYHNRTDFYHNQGSQPRCETTFTR